MSWKDQLYEIDIRESQDLDDLAEGSTEAKNNDVGFVNPNSGAGVLGRENGTLEGFADYGLGFRFNRDNQSLMVFAPNIHVFSTNIQKHDKVVKTTFLQGEYEDIEKLVRGEIDEEL
jgi:hypothetical protein